MKQLIIIIILALSAPSMAAATTQSSCDPGSSKGQWVLESQCSPNAWDDIYVTTRTEGDYKYVVDWCAAPCSQNCLGHCSAYGTSFPSSGATACYAESAKVYKWVCVEKEKNQGPPQCKL